MHIITSRHYNVGLAEVRYSVHWIQRRLHDSHSCSLLCKPAYLRNGLIRIQIKNVSNLDNSNFIHVTSKYSRTVLLRPIASRLRPAAACLSAREFRIAVSATEQ
jgi:hypothetical protein